VSNVVYGQEYLAQLNELQRDYSLNIAYSSKQKSRISKLILSSLLLLVLTSNTNVNSDAFISTKKQDDIVINKDITINTNLYAKLETKTYSMDECIKEAKKHVIYQSDFDYLKYSGDHEYGTLINQMIWNHAFKLYDDGIITGADRDYQCVLFAQMWFYDVYQFNSSKNGAAGDGGRFVDAIYNNWLDEDKNNPYFEYSDKPVKKGLVSIRTKHEGHIICIDDINEEEGTITISDGNYDCKGSIRLRYTMSLDEFYDLYNGTYIYLNPIV